MSFMDQMKLRLYVKKLELTKKRRDKKEIAIDWDKGTWNKKYEDVDFESACGIIGKSPDTRSLFVKDGKIFKGRYGDWVEKYENQLLEIITKHADCPIVELGCGLGRHLFQLHKKGLTNLEGYDVSENAVSLAKRHSAEKGYGIKFGVLDITKPLPDGIIKDKLVFTHGCLEQLKHYMTDVLKNIINGRPKLVINFEVDYASTPYIVRQYLDAMDYQNNLVSELRRLGGGILSIEELPISLSSVNRLSSIIWKIPNSP